MAFPVEEKFIERAESELGVRFPDGFREKMGAENGGVVELGIDCSWLYLFFDDSDRRRLNRTCNHLVSETRYAREHALWPDNLIPTGHNGQGGHLVFRVEDSGTLGQAVYWHDHETNVVHFLAADFSDLTIERT